MFKQKFFYFFILLFLFIILNFSKVYADNSTIIDTYNNVDLSYAYTVSNGNDFIICRNASGSLYELFIVPSNTTCHIVRENHFAFFDSDNNKLYFDYYTIDVQNSSAVFGNIRHSFWTDNGITGHERRWFCFLFYCEYLWFRRYNFFSHNSTNNSSGGDSGEEQSDPVNDPDNSNSTIDYSSGGVFSWIAQGFGNIISSITSSINSIGGWFSELGLTIGDFFSDLTDSIGGWFSELGTNIGNWFSNLTNSIGGFFTDLWNSICSLFVPSLDGSDYIYNIIMNKLSFLDIIKNFFNDIFNVISGRQAVNYLSVNVFSNDYISGTVNIIDLSWYLPFKPFCDLFIVGFAYIGLGFRLFKELPGLLSGSSSVVSFLEGVDFFVNW